MNLPSSISNALKKFGLSDNESLVYFTILQQGETSPFALSKATGIPRTTVYDVIADLALKQLIELEQSNGFTKQQTKIKAKNPSKLREILQAKRKEMVKTEADIINILPLLKGEFHGEDSHADYQFFPGIEGAKKVCLHLFDTGLPRIAWDNLMPMDIFGSQDMNQFTSQETQKNMQLGAIQRELIPLTDWTKHVISYQVGLDENYLLARNIRYIDNPLFTNNLSIIIEENRIFITCAHQNEVWGMILTSPTMSEFLTSLFELEWQKAVPVTLDLVKTWGKNEFVEALEK